MESNWMEASFIMSVGPTPASYCNKDIIKSRMLRMIPSYVRKGLRRKGNGYGCERVHLYDGYKWIR